MKILILTNFDVGLYQFRRELIEELLMENEVYISLPYGDLVQPLIDMGCQFIDTPVDRRGVDPLKDIKLIIKYNSLLNKVKPDMVITYTVKPNVYGGLVCRMKNFPYAVNITGLGTAFQKTGLLRSFVTMLYRLGTKKAKVVFFENAENLKIFVDQKIIIEKQAILLSGAGVNLDHFIVHPYPEETDQIHFLFVGRVMKEKGIDELFFAMKKLRAEGENCVLDVLGGYEEDYADVIAENEKEGWLRYHGYQKDVRPFIAASHCFVLPSWHEGMANTNLECAASGRPIITSRIHGCMEAVEENVSGLLCNKCDSESLYKAMKSFIELEYDKKREMGLAGRARMEKNFDKKAVVAETVAAVLNR